MNLKDLSRTVEATFGVCEAQCGDCNSCRAQSIVEMAWHSGRRSGSSSTAKRDEEKCYWHEWPWDTATQQELIRYAVERGGSAVWVDQQLEAAKQWAESRNERRPNWLAFMKSWLGRGIERLDFQPPQGSLFASAFAKQSDASDSRTQARKRTALTVLRGGSGS